MGEKKKYSKEEFLHSPDQVRECEKILTTVRKYKFAIQKIPINNVVLYRTWFHADSDAGYAHITASIPCTNLPLATQELQTHSAEIKWQTIFNALPELLELPECDALKHVITAKIVEDKTSVFISSLERALSAACLEKHEAQELWMLWMESYHGAVVVGNIAIFDEEAASSGQLRFIWFDECGGVVREARVRFENAQELAAFKYGESLTNLVFLKWWNNPSNVQVGPDYAFTAR